MTSPGRLSRIRAALVHGVVLGVALATSGAAPWVASAHPAPVAGAARTDAGCAPVDREFRPTTLAVDRVLEATEVLARGQDRYGVPKPPPLTDRGKWQFAWDKAAGVRPGGASGVVRLTAHTYPRHHPPDGAEAPALGNLLLARMRAGARLEVTGARGERLCYRVSRRQHVRATDSMSGYYSTTGAHQLAILVCSGKRRGPGDWSHRTIWYATPINDIARYSARWPSQRE